ncbi:MAG: PIG-L family deacetylase [Candidatus Omnitrophica bacterium]|nr:PIG-L family deacetylase [Candidatus Omnitrophota bacterium]
MKQFLVLMIFFCPALLPIAASFGMIASAAPHAGDRILVVAPHPDDEIIGCGGIIQRAAAMDVPLQIVYLTNGDNNQWSFLMYRKHPVVVPAAVKNMGLVRCREATAAMQYLGVPASRLIFLGYPDFKTLTIWNGHWGDRQPARGIFTGARAVPYANAFRPGALHKGEEIVADLKTVIREFAPTKIFLSHPADHNPDHRAAYLFTRVALWELKRDGASFDQPAFYPYLIHFKQWPQPKRYRPELPLLPPSFFQEAVQWRPVPLTAGEIMRKERALKIHQSQYRSSPQYLLSFVRRNELFGDYTPLRLRADNSVAPLPPFAERADMPLPEYLEQDERAAFVGIQSTTISRRGGDVFFTITLSRPVGKAVGVCLYVFGYRDDREFARMPKIRIFVGALRHMAVDQKRKLPKHVVSVRRRAKEITVRVPLSALQYPEGFFCSVDTYLGALPLDWLSWRVVELDGNTHDSSN